MTSPIASGLSTESVSHIDEWGTKMSSVFYNYEMSTARSEKFQANIKYRRMGSITFALIRAQPHQAQRAMAPTAGLAVDDRFSLSLQLEGHSTVSQHGKTRDLDPGDYCTYDPGAPYVRGFDEPTTSLVVLFPRAFLLLPENVLHEASALVIKPSQATLPALYSQLLVGLSGQLDTLDAHSGFRTARATIELLSTSLITALQADSLATNSTADQLRLAVLDFVNEHIADRDLSVGKIAAHFYVSTRYLFQLFSGQGIAQLIRDRRLTLAESKLTDPSLRWMTIAQIAESCGFLNANYFSRVFREHYGLAPAQYRQTFSHEPV